MIIIHTGTNDILTKINTLQKIGKLISAIKEHGTKCEIILVMSSVIYRGDQYFKYQMKEFNTNLENFCEGKGMRFINDNNIDGNCLNRIWLHLNKSESN